MPRTAASRRNRNDLLTRKEEINSSRSQLPKKTARLSSRIPHEPSCLGGGGVQVLFLRMLPSHLHPVLDGKR